METRKKAFGSKEMYEMYANEINWDWLFLKAQLIFGVILFLGVIVAALWFF